MKKVMFCLAATAMIAACGDSADEAASEVAVEAPAPTSVREDYLGSWTVSYPDGSRGVTTNNDDGTYLVEMEDGTSITGTWTFGEDETCWNPDEGETGGCYSVSAPEFDGSRVLTAEDGTMMIVSPVTEAAATEEASDEEAADEEA